MLIKESQSEGEREGERREWTRGVLGESPRKCCALYKYFDFQIFIIVALYLRRINTTANDGNLMFSSLLKTFTDTCMAF